MGATFDLGASVGTGDGVRVAGGVGVVIGGMVKVGATVTVTAGCSDRGGISEEVKLPVCPVWQPVMARANRRTTTAAVLRFIRILPRRIFESFINFFSRLSRLAFNFWG